MASLGESYQRHSRSNSVIGYERSVPVMVTRSSGRTSAARAVGTCTRISPSRSAQSGSSIVKSRGPSTFSTSASTEIVLPV
ncbi:hypothetical protein [Luteitalea sp. TBR-22]|uniref:hypothetical protein n=1 Tax=Luteitalea sp. TBR-22 TaxID=2802971 RepID=UPI00351CE817